MTEELNSNSGMAGMLGDQAGQPPPIAASDAMGIFEDKPSPFNKGNLFLVGLFAAGIACLWVLSLRNGPQKASAEQRTIELQVDAALTMIGPATGRPAVDPKTATVVDTFYYEARQRQVPLETLTANPFAFKAPTAADSVVQQAAQQASQQAQAAMSARAAEESYAKQKAKQLSAAGKLQLQSVLAGAKGATAMISNNLLVEGQQIEGWTIVSIRAREVVMKWQNETCVLKMPQ